MESRITLIAYLNMATQEEWGGFYLRFLPDRQTVRPFEFQQNVQNRLEKSTDWFSLVQKVT